MKEGGFDLKKWYSNSSDLLDYINSQEVGCKRAEVEEVSYAKTLFPNNSDDRKVLGVVWDGLRDVLVFNFGDIIEEALRLPVSKRSVLSIGARFYDPLGLIFPIIIFAKIMFQKLCLDKVDWDNPISEPTKSEWLTYLNKLKQVGNISIPRCVINSIDMTSKDVILHGFCDSSKDAYCAVVYLQGIGTEGTQCGIVASKTKVAPVKQLSIPRLELLACLMLGNLMNNLCKTLENVKFITKKVLLD